MKPEFPNGCKIDFPYHKGGESGIRIAQCFKEPMSIFCGAVYGCNKIVFLDGSYLYHYFYLGPLPYEVPKSQVYENRG